MQPKVEKNKQRIFQSVSSLPTHSPPQYGAFTPLEWNKVNSKREHPHFLTLPKAPKKNQHRWLKSVLFECVKIYWLAVWVTRGRWGFFGTRDFSRLSRQLHCSALPCKKTTTLINSLFNPFFFVRLQNTTDALAGVVSGQLIFALVWHLLKFRHM